MKYVYLFKLGGTGPRYVIAAKTKKRTLELMRENLNSGNVSMHWLNEYCYEHTNGQWWERFSQEGEGIWVHYEPEYLATKDSPNWVRLHGE